MSESSGNLRRSSRIVARVRDPNDSEDCQTPVKNQRETPRKTRNASASNVDGEQDAKSLYRQELEKELETINEDIQKPSELFTEEDVSANQYYGFHTPSKKNAMVQKALLSQTPTTSRTPDRLPTLKVIVEKVEPGTSKGKDTPLRTERRTPAMRRKRIPTGLSSSESESVSEDSEYVPSDNEESADDDQGEISEKDDLENEENSPKASVSEIKKVQFPATPSATRGRRSKKTIAYSDFRLKTDEYFETQSQKVLTSDRTLSRLKNRRLNEEKLKELLNNSHISEAHNEAIHKMNRNYESFFTMWHDIMEEGYSLLLHGLGSKRNLINIYHAEFREIYADIPSLVVNGFFPSLTVKDILDSIIIEILDLDCPTNPNECFDLIEDTLRNNPDDILHLMIHNIDGVMLRSNKAQDTLSRLAAIPNVRLLASVDHINAPLIWDNVKRARYNFYWWDATTLLPYEAETSYESSLLVQHSGVLVLSSLHNVFQSLTDNTKAIYRLLISNQLENEKNPNYTGMAFKDLYGKAREGFLASTDLAFRAQLTEFIDHKLVKIKRNIDGVEYLIIPLDNALLKQFLEQQDEP